MPHIELTEVEFPKRNKNLIVKFFPDKGFYFHFKQILNRLSMTGEEIIEKEYKFYEEDYFRIGEFIDSLKYSDVLHPITKDIIISPFGSDNRYILFVKWVGWEQKQLLYKYPNLKKIEKPELKELVVELRRLQGRIEEFLSRAEKNQISIENFYRTVINILMNSLSAVFPDNIWTLRALTPTPFRLIQIKKFSDKDDMKIKLTPAETRKLVRFLEFYSKELV